MVRGRGIEVTALSLVNQCAETDSTARGDSHDAPNLRHASV